MSFWELRRFTFRGVGHIGVEMSKLLEGKNAIIYGIGRGVARTFDDLWNAV